MLAQQYSTPAQRKRTTHAGTILIVDDNPSNLGFLFDYLEECGFKVLVALDGEEALTQLAHAEPELVLLDIMMPGLDGFETCHRIKQISRDIPVIFMSALGDSQDKLRGFALGAVDYVTKPINKEEVLARITAQMSLQRLQRELRAQNSLLENKRRELEARNEELDAFNHMVAHDLRNALTRILGYSEMLLLKSSGSLDEEDLTDVRHIQGSAVRMREIIQALLLLAGIARQEIELEPVAMDGIIARVLGDLEPRIRACRAEITVQRAWPLVMAYRPWLEIIWANYIENGLKYGGSPPRLELGAGPCERGMMRLWIRDRGPGVPEGARNLLFKPFSRLHPNLAEGHGLGLSIVQRIVVALGGEVGMRLLEQGGSEFFFTLRLA